MRRLVVIFSFLLFSVFLLGQDREARLLRFPDIYNDQVVFVHAGDLWIASINDGKARRLTTSPGIETMPRFSPDGRWIAYTAQYDGNYNVYIIPVAGGEPKQLTFLPDVASTSERSGPNNMVLEWYPDGKKIIFLSRRYTYHTWFGQYFTVSIEGGLPEKSILPKGGLLSFAPDGKSIVYNRKFRNFRTWKRYEGGLAQDLWIYNFEKNSITRLTDYKGTDTYPIWLDEKTVYFVSDRDENRRMNLFRYDLDTRKITQVTHFEKYDVLWATEGSGKIIFENGGYLYLYDPVSNQVSKLSIYLSGDNLNVMPRWVDASKYIRFYSLSPGGKRAVFEARGDIFTVPAKSGETRNLTESNDVHEKYPVWSPDGKWVAYFSDASGEDELYLRRDKDDSEEIRITFDGATFRFPAVWSPDSKKLAFADKSLRLYYVDIEKKKPQLIDRDKVWELRDYTWSPDSRWIAYAKHEKNEMRSIYLYSLEQKKSYRITDEFTDDWQPVFGDSGKYLFFLSNRDINPVLGTFDFSYTNRRTTRIYLVTLKSEFKNPLFPEMDEVQVKEKEKSEKQKSEKRGKKKKEDKNRDSGQKGKESKELRVEVDFEDIQGRIKPLPVGPDNIGSLQVAGKLVFYTTYPTRGLKGKADKSDSELHCFSLEEKEDKVLLTPVGGFDLSPDRKYIIYNSRGKYGISKVSFSKINTGDGSLSLQDMKLKVDPRKEWRQMFNEAWRLERDYFYNPEMNGVDWKAMKKVYEELLPYVSHRSELTFLIGEMIGELANSHTYVGGGDYPKLESVSYGLLGIDFEPGKNGFYRIAHIYKGDNSRERYRSPLTEPGVDVRKGDYLLAIDGKTLKVPDNPYRFLENKAGKLVTLTVNRKPTFKGSRQIEVKTIRSELSLRYLEWIRNNRERVEKLSNGKIGYIYLPDMSSDGLVAFIEQFYPQIRKEGLIIDVRYNGGGFVDQLILERLRRILVGMEMARNGYRGTIPSQVFHGYLACICNEYSASDGDIFPYFFKEYGLGPVIGMRTWGGVRGIRGIGGLIDGGYVTVPEFSLYNLRGEWVMENHGVEPDIVVDNLPSEVVKGKDPQLEKAVEVLLKKIKEKPPVLPELPPWLPPYPEK